MQASDDLQGLKNIANLCSLPLQVYLMCCSVVLLQMQRFRQPSIATQRMLLTKILPTTTPSTVMLKTPAQH